MVEISGELDPVGVVLADVRDMAPVTVAEIATGTGYSETTVRRVLKRLEESELVESDDYQRRARVYLASTASMGAES